MKCKLFVTFTENIWIYIKFVLFSVVFFGINGIIEKQSRHMCAGTEDTYE